MRGKLICNKQRGFTSVEFILATFALGAVIFICYLLYAAIHFINKFW